MQYSHPRISTNRFFLKKKKKNKIPSQHFPAAVVRDAILVQCQCMLPEDRMVEVDQNDDMVKATAI